MHILHSPGRRAVRRLALLAVCVLGATLLSAPSSSAAKPHGPRPVLGNEWPVFGHDLSNTRSNPAETQITPRNAGRLKAKWTYRTHGDVSATPAVVGGAVYFPDWGGYLHKLDAATGEQIWSRRISEYNGAEGSVSRTSPAVVDGTVYIGDYDHAFLMAVDAATGDLVWRRKLDDQFLAVLTQSPVVYKGVVYQGVSSRESEMMGADPTYECCVFRGSMNAVDADTGEVLWRRYTVPDNGGQPGGYSGVAVWGPPAIDPQTNTVYFTSGNNYQLPQDVKDCQAAGGTPGECMAEDNYVDSVLALDMATGNVKWHTGAKRFDAWNSGCVVGLPPDNCPTGHGGDYDFGDGAHLFTIRRPDGTLRKVVGAGEKSGEYWLMDALTGEIIWSAAAGPGGHVGGIMWGTAYDGKRVYLTQSNFDRLDYTLADGTVTKRSSYVALDPQTGRILWQVADHTDGFAWGALTVAGKVLFASSTSGRMYAMDAATGRYLWEFDGPYSSNAGPAVVDGTVYWGNGYFRFANGGGTTGSTTEGTFYAFTVDGN
ncbi:Polyvinylalcohol dehydrogenase [Streptomyces sp. RB5]|uniref:Polyvinylalcohol dehydrogenase n=1 Tax=Streptomyces smaragdinus TaxID=2585196 RepID=A0A7K0CL06_9ACTN|nr:PQQ-binding-like beta-propeller repeat protein [Streptomyces smaragdinus]MQY14091.1 Polyvinylalcohol dehydrogenase [Streptomyces smaragdinus]